MLIMQREKGSKVKLTRKLRITVARRLYLSSFISCCCASSGTSTRRYEVGMGRAEEYSRLLGLEMLVLVQAPAYLYQYLYNKYSI
jgi:hypothetical protein